MQSGQQPTSRINVLASGGTDGGDDTLVVQGVAEPGHGVVVGTLQWNARYGMVTDKVHPATQTTQQPRQLLDVILGVVQLLENDILE